MKEGGIQVAICGYLSTRGHFFWRQNTIPVFDVRNRSFRRMPRFSMAGIPDIILIKDGRFIGIEVKNERGRQSTGQLLFETNCKRAGGEYHVVRSVRDVIGLGL